MMVMAIIKAPIPITKMTITKGTTTSMKVITTSMPSTNNNITVIMKDTMMSRQFTLVKILSSSDRLPAAIITRNHTTLTKTVGTTSTNNMGTKTSTTMTNTTIKVLQASMNMAMVLG